MFYVPIHELPSEVKLGEHDYAIGNKVFLFLTQVLDGFVKVLLSLFEHLLKDKEGLLIQYGPAQSRSPRSHCLRDQPVFALNINDSLHGQLSFLCEGHASSVIAQELSQYLLCLFLEYWLVMHEVAILKGALDCSLRASLDVWSIVLELPLHCLVNAQGNEDAPLFLRNYGHVLLVNGR